MSTIGIHNRLNQIIAMYYSLHIWQREGTSYLQVIVKLFYYALHLSYVMAVFLGIFLCEDNEIIFQIAVFLAYLVINVKLYYILWKQIDICSFLYEICSHSVSNSIDVMEINRKINVFVRFATYFLIMAALGTVPFFCFRLPIFSSQRKLPLTIGFPLNWRNNVFYYWTAYFYVTINHFLTAVYLSSTVIIWYIMINCSIKNESLGRQLGNLGTNTVIANAKISEAEKRKLYLHEYIDFIRNYQKMRM